MNGSRLKAAAYGPMRSRTGKPSGEGVAWSGACQPRVQDWRGYIGALLPFAPSVLAGRRFLGDVVAETDDEKHGMDLEISASHQVCRPHTERIRHPHDVIERHIALPALDRPHVRSV
jgi:hypothetical protein